MPATTVGQLTFRGERVYHVAMATDDGRAFAADIAADSPRSAETRIMAAQPFKLAGQQVRFETTRLGD